MNPSHHTCDCGYTWRHGKSGSHSCTPHYQSTIADLRAALSRQSADDHTTSYNRGYAAGIEMGKALAADEAAAPQSVAVGGDAGNSFRNHLQHCSDVVATWPAWKRRANAQPAGDAGAVYQASPPDGKELWVDVSKGMYDATAWNKRIVYTIPAPAAQAAPSAIDRMANSGTADSFMLLPDADKRLFFAQAVADSVKLKKLEQAATPSPAVLDGQNYDDVAVDRFATAMKHKLAVKRDEGRGGWNKETECSIDTLAQMLVGHVPKGDPVDIANFAMMLHQREVMAMEHHPCHGGCATRAIRKVSTQSLAVHESTIADLRVALKTVSDIAASKHLEQQAAQPDTAAVRDALAEIIGCFEAATIEGLPDITLDSADERLKDLVVRRLMPAYGIAQGALHAMHSTPATPSDSGAVPLCVVQGAESLPLCGGTCAKQGMCIERRCDPVRALLSSLDELRVILQQGTVTIDKIHELGADGPTEEAWLLFYDEIMPLMASINAAQPSAAPAGKEG